MNNVEKLRNYFLGKDPQLKETMADNSLRLIGIPGREFVLKAELYKRLKELTDALEAEQENRIAADETLQGNIDTEARIRSEADEALAGDLSTLDHTVDEIINWANTSDFVYVNDLETRLLNYYTKAQVNELISVIPRFDIEVVEELPTEDISTTTIYLLAKEDGSGNDYYDEYIYLDNQWELIGSTSVDLSNYYTKTEADNKFMAKLGMKYIEEELQVTQDKTSDIAIGYYIPTPTSNPDYQAVSDINFCSGAFNVIQGEIYTITGKGGGTGKLLYALYDESGNGIAFSSNDQIETDFPLYIPKDGILVLNFTDDTTYPYEVSAEVYRGMKDLDGIYVNQAGDTMTGGLTLPSMTLGSRKQNSSIGSHSAVIGTLNEASGARSVAEGQGTSATANNAHAEGQNTVAGAANAHAEGGSTTASGNSSHAEGSFSTASGDASHSEGYYTEATRFAQHVEGEYNILDTGGQNGGSLGTYTHIVGNGTSDNARSNAHTLDWSGNAWFSGDVYVGSTSGTNKDAGSKKLATEDVFTGTDGLVDGAKGLVPAPTTADDGKFLCADGTWQAGGGGGTTITYGTTDLTPGVSPLAEGTFYFCYE